MLSPKEFLRQTAGLPAATTNDVALAKPKIIAPGMQVTITVAQDPGLNRQVPVPPSGVIDFPGAGRLAVAGLTVEEVAEKVRAPLERDFFKKADVTVTIETVPAAAPGAVGIVYVLGNVNRPGPLQLPPNEVFTVMKVVLAAGGFAPFANGAKVRLIRYDATGKKFETTVSVERIMKTGAFEDDLPVQNGDYIIVPEKWISF
jgi:polysaccharide export outer membrane protein